jgi:hypothetical protein
MTTEQEAARSLIKRALEAEGQGEADILISAAMRLDKTIDAEAIAKIWREQWLKDNAGRKPV